MKMIQEIVMRIIQILLQRKQLLIEKTLFQLKENQVLENHRQLNHVFIMLFQINTL